jgi:hypothetical protein
VKPNLSAVVLDNLPADGEPNSVAGILGARVQAVEHDKYLLSIFGSNANSVIANSECTQRAGRFGLHRNHGWFFSAKLDGVPNQILEDPRQLPAIGPHIGQRSTGNYRAALFNGRSQIQESFVDRFVTRDTAARDIVPANPGRHADFIAVADLNGDGHPDVVTANGWTVVVLLGNGDGTFLVDGNYNQGGAGSPSIVIADINGDGLPDLVVSNPCWNPQVCTVGEVGVMVGNGDGSFNSAVRYTTGGTFTASVAVGDWNGDGRPDIAVANSGSDSIGVFLNAFVATTTTKIAASPNPAQVG